MGPGSVNGGFIVIAMWGDERRSGGTMKFDNPDIRHFDTEAEARENAESFVRQREGNEAFLVPAIAHFYNPYAAKK